MADTWKAACRKVEQEKAEYGGYAAQKMLFPGSHTLQTVTICRSHKEILVTM